MKTKFHIKKQLILAVLCICNYYNVAFSQCMVNFGSLGSGIIVENGGTQTATISYNIWDETTGACGSGGINDMTVTFQTINTFDTYGGTAVHTTNGTNYKIEYTSSGFRGTLPHGNIAATRSSPGDVRCYKISVDFASHISNIVASDFEVDLTSVNTGGTAFESMALIFKDRSDIPYGSATYAGYYQMNPGNTHPGIVTACPNAPPLPNISSSPWFTSGIGVYIAAANSVNINTNSCTPATGTSGTNDDADILASNTGLSANAGIGGFEYTLCLENVGTFTSDVALTSVSTLFTSTLNGFTISGTPLPSQFTNFRVENLKSKSLISFSTASETNNDYFTIERSADGRNFDAIGEIKGAGNSNQELSYEFVDESPLAGINYYRIKQTDFDGAYSYTEIRSVRHQTKKVIVSPNRTDGKLNVTSELDNYDVVIYNTGGQEVQRHMALSGDQSLSIETLQAGVYFVKVMDQTIRILKF